MLTDIRPVISAVGDTLEPALSPKFAADVAEPSLRGGRPAMRARILIHSHRLSALNARLAVWKDRFTHGS